MQQHKRTVEPNGSDCRRSNSPAMVSSKFFKIILPSIIHEKKLRIPEKFVRMYGDELSAVAMLTIPTGHVSHVGLEKSNKMLWFCDGWQQFMEHHSISYGYFLVFKYKRNSSFDVLIFDLTATEVQYSCSIRSSSEEPNNGKQCQLSDEEEIEDDDSVEILGTSGFVGSSSKFSLGLNKKGKSAALLESLEPTSRDLTRSKRYKKDQDQTIELENLLGVCGRTPSRSEMSNWHDPLFDKSKRKNQFVTKNVENLQTPAQPVCDRGFDPLNESELKDKTYRIDVEEQHPTKNANSSQVATQKNRHTNHQFDSKTTNKRTISNGQESLVNQEWCAEMLGTNTHSTTCSTKRPVINQARERAINAARMFKPENHFHMFILRSCNVNNHVLYIPSEFATKMRYFLGVSDFVKLQVSDGKEWRVGCFHGKGGGTYLRKGWTKFVKENNLVEGDICVFVLTKDKDFVLEVSIFCSSSEEPYNGKQCQLSDGSVKISGSSGFVGSSSKFSLGFGKKGKSAALLESLEPTSRDLTRSKRYKKDQEQTIELENLLGVCGRTPSRSEISNWHDPLFDKSKRKNQFVTKNVENLQTPAQPVRDRGFDPLNESELKDKTYRIDVEEQHPTKNANSSQVATQKNRHTSHRFDSKTTNNNNNNQRTISIGNESLEKQEWCAEMLGPNTRSTTCLTRRPLLNQARERAINAARMFKPENPFHMVILRSYNVNSQYVLYIPSEFGMKMKYLLGVSDMVKLQVSDGREWRVRCIPQNGGTKFSKGWAAFVKENSLAEGDICVFELSKVEDFVIKVSIFRTAGYAGQANQPLK